MQTMLVKYKKILYLVTRKDHDDKCIYNVYKKFNDRHIDYISHSHLIKFDGYKETWVMSITPYNSMLKPMQSLMEGNLQEINEATYFRDDDTLDGAISKIRNAKMSDEYLEKVSKRYSSQDDDVNADIINLAFSVKNLISVAGIYYYTLT